MLLIYFSIELQVHVTMICLLCCCGWRLGSDRVLPLCFVFLLKSEPTSLVDSLLNKICLCVQNKTPKPFCFQPVRWGCDWTELVRTVTQLGVPDSVARVRWLLWACGLRETLARLGECLWSWSRWLDGIWNWLLLTCRLFSITYWN